MRGDLTGGGGGEGYCVEDCSVEGCYVEVNYIEGYSVEDCCCKGRCVGGYYDRKFYVNEVFCSMIVMG